MGKQMEVAYIFPTDDEKKAMKKYGQRLCKAIALTKIEEKLGEYRKVLIKAKKFVERFNQPTKEGRFVWDPKEVLGGLEDAHLELLKNIQDKIKALQSAATAISEEAGQLTEKIFCGEHSVTVDDEVDGPEKIPTQAPERFGEPLYIQWNRCEHLEYN